MKNMSILILVLISLVPGEGRPSSSRDPMTSVNEVDQSPEINNRGGFLESAHFWPEGIVYYQFGKDVGAKLKSMVLEAMALLEKATGSIVKFREDTTREEGVVVISETYQGVSCVADVGYYEYFKTILAVVIGTSRPDCGGDPKLYGVGIIVHELMHTLGFLHEFQRKDRDKFIRFNKTAVLEYYARKGFPLGEDGYKLAFGKPQDTDSKGLPFDFKSITNYEISELVTEVKNPVPNPKPIGNKKNTGQICSISAGDRNLILLTYYKQSGLTEPPKLYTEDYKLPGYGKSGCREALDPMMDERE